MGTVFLMKLAIRRVATTALLFLNVVLADEESFVR